jgi:hypothetical protein
LKLQSLLVILTQKPNLIPTPILVKDSLRYFADWTFLFVSSRPY